VNVLRPLLSTTSEEIHTYLSNHEIPYAQDPTNRSLEQHRTKIRHQVVPVLREIRAAAAINANRSAQLLQTDRDFIDDMAATAYARCSLKGPSLAMDKFLREHPSLKHRILVCWLTQACGISRPALTSDSLCQMQGWLSKSPRGQFDLQRKRFEVAQNRLWLELPIDLQQVPLLNEPSVAGQKDLPWLGVSAQYQISGPLNAQTPNHDIHQEAFDLDALKGPLTFRTRRNGDRVKCFDERAGSITIGNLFTNSKIPKSIRNHWPILTDANGEILWVLGLRRGREAPITQNTQKVLIVTITGCIPTSVA